MSLTLFGDRVAIEVVDETWEGRVLLPEVRQKLFVIGRVILASCQRLPKVESALAVAAPGDLVLFQMNPSNSGFKWNGKPATILHPCDLIGRLDKPTTDFHGFIPLGNWVMVEKIAEKMRGGILLPDSADHDKTDWRFKATRQGPWVTPDLGNLVGEEVVLERNRLNPIRVDGKDFGYIDKAFVHGVVTV